MTSRFLCKFLKCNLNKKYCFPNSIFSPKTFSKCSTQSSKDFGKYKLNKELESKINEQINFEQAASQAYLAIAGYLGNVNIARKGCFKFFIKMHKEETGHALELINYQLLRGGTVSLRQLSAPSMDETTILQCFERALKMEMDITADIENLVELANKHNDLQCADYITSVFLKEQMESINELANMVTNLRNLGSNDRDMFIFDLDLDKKYS